MSKALKLFALSVCLWLLGTGTAIGAPPEFDNDGATTGPFDSDNVAFLDQKTPRQMGLTDVPNLADVWGWTDPANGDKYVIAPSSADLAFSVVPGSGDADYAPVGGVSFLRVVDDDTLVPLGTWRHPGDFPLGHGDAQVFANNAYVAFEDVNDGVITDIGLAIFDLTKLRGLDDCGTPDLCKNNLSDLDGFATIRREFEVLGSPNRTIPFSDAHNLTIDEETGWMAIHAAGTVESLQQGVPPDKKRRPRHTYVLKIDESDPTNPILVRDVKTFSHDGFITTYNGPDVQHQGKVIMLLANGYRHEHVFNRNPKDVEKTVEKTFLQNPQNRLTNWQLAEPDGTIKIKKLGFSEYDGSNFGHQLALSSDHRHVFFNDENNFIGLFGFEQQRQIVFDIQDLDRPKESLQCFHNTFGPTHDSYVVENFLYAGNYTTGLRVVDISTPASLCTDGGFLAEAGFFDTEPRLEAVGDNFTVTLNQGAQSVDVQPADPNFAGVWGTYPFFGDGLAVESDIYNGIFLLRFLGA